MRICFASIVLSLAAISPAAEFKIGERTFTLPEGFSIELVAASPLVDRPIEADLDDKGRLYVTDSSGSNDKVEKQLAEKPHRVVRLEDTNGDGKYDKSLVFGDKLMLPEGAMWLDGSLYVSAPPSIWKLTDTDNDGVADKREEWFKGGTLTGCANDLHGPYAGPDGWIYWNKGAFAKQTHERAGQPPIVTRASHTFRMRPDGTRLETVMTGGMDNPVGLAFTPEGERFFTATFLLHPEGGKRDGLVHAIYGGVYGKQNDVNDDHPQTGELMPITTHLGAAAPVGVMRYKSGAMGMKNDLFVCQFNLHKVSRHILKRDGATYKTEDTDFVVSSDTDFHPTDVLEDSDGSIIIIDTGAWYKLCCPTSQLAKPDVLGAIYRVRKTGMQKPAANSEDKLDKLWALVRQDSSAARDLVRAALDDEDVSVRIAAAHGVSVWRDSHAQLRLLKMLENGSPPEKRVAAEALGRLGDERAIPGLLQAASGEIDRTLEHSLAFALIEIGKAHLIRAGIEARHFKARKVALLALSQIPGALRAQDVAPFLFGQAELRDTAQWIASRNPSWGETLADVFRQRVTRKEFTANEAKIVTPVLARLAQTPKIQDLLADFVANEDYEPAVVGLRAMVASGIKKAPPRWFEVVARAIATDEDLRNEAISTARALNPTKDSTALNEALAKTAAWTEAPAPLRIAAARALPEGATLPPPVFQLLLENTSAKAPVEARADAIATLNRAGLTDTQRLELADRLAVTGPMELARVLDAVTKTPSEPLGLRIVQALKKSQVIPSLPRDFVMQRLAKFPDAVKQAAAGLPSASQSDGAGQRARLEEIFQTLKDGDVRRGQAIFNDSRTACASCHAMGYLGGKVGPDLTTIGQVRTELDLLEAIVFPSASFVRSYEPVIVKTKDGEPHTGILRGDNSEAVTIVTGPNTEERIARADIEEMVPGSVSIMPAGLDTQLSKQELADLVAFLKATKWGAN